MNKINEQLNIRQDGNTHAYSNDLFYTDWTLDQTGVQGASKGNAIAYAASGCSSCSGANGESFSEIYGRNKCKNHCDTLFTDPTLLTACEGYCKSRCKIGASCPNKTPFPTKTTICRGLNNYNDDCSRKGGSSSSGGSTSGGSAPTAQASMGGGSGSTMLIVGGVLVLAAIGFGAYKLLKK